MKPALMMQALVIRNAKHRLKRVSQEFRHDLQQITQGKYNIPRE